MPVKRMEESLGREKSRAKVGGRETPGALGKTDFAEDGGRNAGATP